MLPAGTAWRGGGEEVEAGEGVQEGKGGERRWFRKEGGGKVTREEEVNTVGGEQEEIDG